MCVTYMTSGCGLFGTLWGRYSVAVICECDFKEV